MEQRPTKRLPFCITQGDEGSFLSIHAASNSLLLYTVRFVKLALTMDISNFLGF